MQAITRKFKYFFTDPRCLFLLGLVISVTATAIEVARGRNTNYFDYQDSTRMFFEGISAYTMEYVYAHEIYFLYTPVFNMLFAPVFILPWWLGPFVWNIGNYCLFSLAIWTLPDKLKPYRELIFLFLLSVLMQAIFCYQYNTVVCYIFIFAFTLLERGKGFWAVLLIMISACTKIYGAAELALLLMYPKMWRNFGYAILTGAALLLLPALNFNMENPLSLYTDMFNMITSHHSDADFIGILFARGLKPFLLPNYRLVQLSVLGILAIAFFWRRERWKNFEFRVQALAVIMGYIILFSDSPETHTYLISLTGYQMAFWLQQEKKWYDWGLFWLLIINFGILPTDVLCPAWLHEYIHETFWLDVYTFLLCWLRIIWWALRPAKHIDKILNSKVAVTTILLIFLPFSSQAQKRVSLTRSVIVRNIRYDLKFIQGGSLVMGAMTGDTLADSDEARHQVMISNFYMGETEVTQELWEAVMPKNRSKIKGAKHPVENITFDQCKEFIARLNKLTGMTFRLPTEAEWEWAARGGRHSKGYLYSGSNDIQEVAWTWEQCASYNSHMEVKKKKPNELGLYDMSGNVSEWCEDFYHPYITTKPQINPCNREPSSFHVVRGGAYRSPARYSRTTNRYMYDTRRKWGNLGFRLAM